MLSPHFWLFQSLCPGKDFCCLSHGECSFWLFFQHIHQNCILLYFIRWVWVKSYETLSDLLPLPQVSLKCRAPEVSQCVFQSYEAVLKNWRTSPQWRDSATVRSLSPDPPTMTHLRALQGPLAVVLADDPLCVSVSRLIRWLMIVFLFLPRLLHIISSRCTFVQTQVSVFCNKFSKRALSL